MANSITRAMDKLSGKSTVNNANNPGSATAKITASIVKKQQPASKFVSTLPRNQKVFGAGI